jgi:hypothetical protein
VIHDTLCHLGISSIKRLIRAGHVKIADPTTRTAVLALDSLPCVDCAATSVSVAPKSKVGHVPHQDEAGLFSSDVCFINVPSLGGSVMFAGWICHRNDWVTISYHKTKDSVTPWFIRNKDSIERAASTAMRLLRTDNGGEYTNLEMITFCANERIARQMTSPASSFQNGKIERFFRTVRAHAGASLRRSGLGSRFWAEAVALCVYVHNRLPTATRGSPFEAVFGRTPSLALVHPFGCQVWAHTDVSKSGMRDRAIECVYLSPATATKDGHKLLNLTSRRIIVSRSCRFSDTIFPLAEREGSMRSRVEPQTAFEESDMPVLPASISQYPSKEGLTTVGVPHGDDEKDQERAVDVADDVEAAGAAGVDDALGNFFGDVVDALNGGNLRTPRVRAPPASFDPSGYDAQRKHDRQRKANAEANVSTSHAQQLYDGVMARVTDDEPVPKTLSDIFALPQGDNRELWIDSVRDELRSQINNGTWRETDRNSGRKAIGARFVFKIKTDSNGVPSRCKTRLVAKGYTQRSEIDFGETYSPTLRFNTLKALLASSVQHRVEIHQMDITTAFLNAPLEEELNLRLPEFRLLQEMLPDLDLGTDTGEVRLQRSIYGLKQSPRNWSDHISSTLAGLGFVQSHCDPCLWLKCEGGVFRAAVAYFVDDILICARGQDLVDTKAALSSAYKLTDGGPVSFFLGIRMIHNLDVQANTATLTMVQDSATKALLSRYNMLDARVMSTPADPAKAPSADEPTQEELDYMDGKNLRALVGSLMYLLVTRPDISNAVNHLARAVNKPRKADWQAAMHLLRYLAGTIYFGLKYTSEEETPTSAKLVGYCDADWGGDKKTRRSTSGHVFMLSGGPIAHKCRLQRIVALSSCEAELVALALGFQELTWLRRLLIELCVITNDDAIVMNEDNKAAIQLATDRRFSERTKHMDIKYFYIAGELEANRVVIEYCETAKMIADIMTKPLGRVVFQRLRDMLGVKEIKIAV